MSAHDLASTLPSPTRMLSAALLATLLAALAVSSIGVWAVSDSLEDSAAIARREERTAYLVSTIGRNVSRMRARLLEALVDPDEASSRRLEATRQIAERTRVGRDALPVLLGPEEQEIWRGLQPRLDRMLARFDRIIEAIQSGRTDDARRLLEITAYDSVRVSAGLEHFEQVSLQDTEAAIAQVQHRTAHTLEVVAIAKVALLAAVGLAWILVLRIVADQRRVLAVQIERLEASNRDLEAFAGRVAHDMRNVLGPMQLGTEAIVATTTEPRLREIAARLQRSCARGRALVDGLLAFSRATDPSQREDEPAQPDTAARAHVGTELDDVLDQLDATIADAEVRVTTRVAADVEVALARPLLHAVLLNVVDNAVKFMRGRAERHLTIAADASASTVKLTVSDTGPGIPANERRRVFDALYRGATRLQEGTGLGLATVKRIVECHGGHIEIAASGPHGTTFVVTLPRAHTSTTSPDARP